MGILRYGDYPNNPKDRKMVEGIVFDLDMITTSWTEAHQREAQLERSGKMVDVNPRFASPEEAHEHLDTGEMTKVWEVWVGKKYARRAHKMTKPKAMISTDNVNKAGKKLLKATVGLTVAGMTLGLGMGLIGGMGAMLRKKGKNAAKKRKATKCRCKK